MPFIHKIGPIKILFYCDFDIYSKWEFFHLDIREINDPLGKNEYPPCVVDNEIKLFLDKRLEDNSD